MPASGKIENRKFPERLFGGGIVSPCRVYCGLMARMVDLLAVLFKLSFPFVFAFAPRNTAKSARVCIADTILCALRWVCGTKIAATIIQSITVFMIAILPVSRRQSKDLAVHVNSLPYSVDHNRPSRIERAAITPPCKPLPSRKSAKVILINERYLTPRKFNRKILMLFHWYTPLYEGTTRQEKTLCLSM